MTPLLIFKSNQTVALPRNHTTTPMTCQIISHLHSCCYKIYSTTRQARIRSTLQWDISVLPPGTLHLLVPQELQVFTQSLSGLSGVQDIVHEASLRSHHGISESADISISSANAHAHIYYPLIPITSKDTPPLTPSILHGGYITSI